MFYDNCRNFQVLVGIGGFRGGAKGAAAPPFFVYFQNVLPLTLRICFKNRFIKCSLILSSETLTLLYFASRIRSQCCMQVKFSMGGGGGMEGEWGTWPPLSEFSGSAPGWLASAVKTDRGNVTGVPGHLVI